MLRMASRRIEAVLVDLSGTLHIDDLMIPGSVEALKRLRSSGLKIKFVTNTTKESKRILCDRLNNLSFDIHPDEIFTSLTAARRFVESKGFRPLLLLEDVALEDFDGIPQDNPNAVVVGLAPSRFNYDSMNEAFRLVADGAILIAIHKARYYKRTDGLALGPGPFVSAIEFATDTQAEVVGKPEQRFFLSALEAMNATAEKSLMIGDDARDDIAGAQAAGMLGILVKTGKYRDGDESKISPPPHKVCASFPDAVEYIVDILT